MIIRNPFRRPIPEYYDRMYMDGFEPWEILTAAHQKMIAAAEEEPQESYTVNVKSTVEVKR